MKYINLIIFILFLLVACSKDKDTTIESEDILDRLKTLKGMTVTEIPPQYGYPREFQLDIEQPVDHDNPGGQTFTQRAYLFHSDVTRPMIFAPGGYGTTDKTSTELSGIMQTNTLSVTHRYFNHAKPNPIDYKYLNIKQSAADHHQIVTIMKQIYNGPWLSSGVSKSGLTALFHKRFYPDDVKATVAYVSPFCFSTKDSRYQDYIKKIGDENIRKQISGFQIFMLENRNELIPMVRKFFLDKNLELGKSADEVFEYAIIEFPFTFWQYNSLHPNMISQDSTLSQKFNFLARTANLQDYSVQTSSYYEPYYYQALTELGYPAYEISDIQDLLKIAKNPSGEFYAPDNVIFEYKPEAMKDIYEWLQTKGNNIIYIYGSIDPWSAGAIELTGQVNAIKIMHPGGDHRTKITQLENPQIVYDALETWLGIDIFPQQTGIKIDMEYIDNENFK